MVEIADPFTTRLQEQYSNNPEAAQSIKNPYSDPFTERLKTPEYKDHVEEKEEGFIKSSARTLLQPLMGYLSVTPPGLMTGFFSMLAQGEMYDQDAIDSFKRQSEKYGIPFDEEKYLEAADSIMKYIPTVHNLGREVEEHTGLPLEAKTRVQKGIRFLTEATKLSPSGATLRPLNVGLPKPVLGAGVEATKEVLQEMGMPEPLAELASFAILKQPASGSPSLTIGRERKPSGMKTRRYEKIGSETKVSPEKINKLNRTVENEFKDIASEIIEKSPINETYSSLKNDVTFKQQAKESFKEVSKIAESLPNEIHTHDVKKAMVDQVMKKKGTGFTPSEFDKVHKKYIKEFIKETPAQNIKATDLVTQYRKNNEALSQAFEPGQSFAYNRGKREALLDYNRAIAEVIENQFPNSEFSNLFKSTNKQWASIMDAEFIDKFMDKLFDGKIRFEKGRNFFDKEGMTVPFKRALGEEGFKEFETLMKDLMSTEQANSLLKKAKAEGWQDFAKTGLAYLTHPWIGKAKFAHSAYKYASQKAMEFMLDKPKIALKWNRGLQAAKKGEFGKAERIFEEITAESEAIKPEVLQKPTRNEPAKAPGETIEVKAERINPEKPKEIEHKPKEIEHPIPKEKVKEDNKEILKKYDKSPVEKTKLDTKKKLDEKINKAAHQDITKKGLKEQKNFIKNELQDIYDNIEKINNSILHLEHMREISFFPGYDKSIASYQKQLREFEKRKIELEKQIKKPEKIFDKSEFSPKENQSLEEWKISIRKKYPNVTDKALDLMSKKYKFF